MNSPAPADPASPAAELESTLAAVEARLQGLQEALRERDAAAMEQQADQLHRALAAAVQRFAHAARRGAVPPALRSRLAAAGAQVAAQREALARATAALDRAIDVLLPGMHAPVYSADGTPDRASNSGMVQA